MSQEDCRSLQQQWRAVTAKKLWLQKAVHFQCYCNISKRTAAVKSCSNEELLLQRAAHCQHCNTKSCNVTLLQYQYCNINTNKMATLLQHWGLQHNTAATRRAAMQCCCNLSRRTVMLRLLQCQCALQYERKDCNTS